MRCTARSGISIIWGFDENCPPALKDEENRLFSIGIGVGIMRGQRRSVEGSSSGSHVQQNEARKFPPYDPLSLFRQEGTAAGLLSSVKAIGHIGPTESSLGQPTVSRNEDIQRLQS